MKCYWRTFRVSWMVHGSPVKQTFTWMATLTSRMSNFGPQGIQGLTLPAHCIQRGLEYGVRYWVSEYSVPRSLIVCSHHFWCIPQSSEWWIFLFPDEIWHSSEISLVSTRWCQTSYQQCLALLSLSHFQEEFCILRCLRKDSHGHQPHWTSTLAIIFCGSIWRIGCFRKIHAQFCIWKLTFNQRDWSHLYKNANQGSEKFCSLFA